MPTWSDVVQAEAALARAVEARLCAHRHHVLATLRADGSPRVWGTEVVLHRGELLLGSMVPSVKVSDLRRDPRFALHTNPGDETMTGGDAKLSGLAMPLDPAEGDALTAELDAPAPAVFFRLDVQQVVLTTFDAAADVMRVISWTADRGRAGWTRHGSGPAIPD